ncbi:hypothetical protein [Yimella sp. NH-Cas1]|uniref:hypothetical protein n=1 Tax=Yimella sp. NH-Cas1 TaxID=2917726 RepID=UPI001EFAE7BA|nr:hypothetical protein [Yimella sp. NH-Cas1]MCG8656773.1 hypothetical protein [Yimella sp. NH-Cas1]
MKSVSVEPTKVAQPQPGATTVTATWPGGNSNPLYPLSASPTTDFEIRDSYLAPRHSLDTATTSTEVATSAFLSD